jgi:methionyl-tRNA formyltransferase
VVHKGEEARIGFAGDREIAVRVLEYMLQQGGQPLVLLVPDGEAESHAQELVSLCPFLEAERVIRGADFSKEKALQLFRELDLDYMLCVHFPYVVPTEVLSTPRVGFLNLHPAYLPYNRGWHTASWAILEGTPIGATLHFMDQGIDTGDIVHQKKIDVSPGDTAHSLYVRLQKTELEVFKEAWPRLVARSYQRVPQNSTQATTRRRKELYCDQLQRIDLDEMVRAGNLIRRLRALTTSRVEEAAYFEEGELRYRVQIIISQEAEREQ